MIRRVAAILAISVCATSGLGAQQQTRVQLLRSATTAYDDFAPDRALDFLRSALDPSLGAPDTAWTRGVHLLTQILVEGNKPDLARTWARWAVRTSPNMAIDTVNFLAGVVAAFREARTSTVRTPGDGLSQTSWRWSARGSTEPNGRILINQGTMTAAVNARIVGGTLIPAGQGLSLPPGTYEIEAAAVGFLPARVTREVLPGVTTALTLNLTSMALATLPENIRQRTFANLAPLTVHRFGAPPACAAGVFVGRDGLLVTSYQAIRGADSVTTTTAGARVMVAAHDVAAGVAILRVAGPRTDSVALTSVTTDGQSLWGVHLADCRTPSEARVRVAQVTAPPNRVLQLADSLPDAPVGSPLIDREGRLAGVWAAPASAIPASTLAPLLDQARRASEPTTLADVARKENHLYGVLAIAADVATATINVSPVETWQWESLAASGPAPFTFAGPIGRYRIVGTSPDGARREQFLTLRPGTTTRLVVSMRTVAVGTQASVPVITKRRSKLPWIIGGAGGLAVAAAVALGGGGDKPAGPGTGGGGSTGGISILVPINPP